MEKENSMKTLFILSTAGSGNHLLKEFFISLGFDVSMGKLKEGAVIWQFSDWDNFDGV